MSGIYSSRENIRLKYLHFLTGNNKIVLLLFSFLTFLWSSVFAQSCNKIESKSFFRSIRTGNPVPAKLMGCSKIDHFIPGHQGRYIIEYALLDKKCRKKYADVFYFMGTLFSYADISTNENGYIRSITLFSFFNDNRTDSVINKLPGNFISVYNKLLALYGQPACILKAEQQDSLWYRDTGFPYSVEWECENINLQLRVRYGSKQERLNVIAVLIEEGRRNLPPFIERLD